MNHNRGALYPEFVVGWEEHPWRSKPEYGLSRRARLAARGPYQAAIAVPIAQAVINVEAGLQAEAEDALRQITRFDAEVAAFGQRLSHDHPGPAPMELMPLASVLLRTESASSSQIEGITAGARALALAAIDSKTGVNARMITANVTAMQKALALSDDIGVDSLLAAHHVLLEGHAYAAPGQIRERQVWIGARAISPHTAEFVPPHHTNVRPALNDLIAFIHRADVPILTQVAIAHAQLETIHPFNDGNGRIGRALVHAMLRHAGVTRSLTIPISAGLLAETSAYFEALTHYRAGYIEPIVAQFTHAALRAVSNGKALVDELEAIYHDWSNRLPSRRGAAARRLLPQLLSQPAVNVSLVETLTGVALSAAQRAIQQLELAQILTPVSQNRRNRSWVAPEVIDALDAFADRARRRAA